MSFKKSFLLLCLLLQTLCLSIKAQQNTLPAISADYFRSPLDIPLYLAGNFGEIRTNHFHSGIDIKTNQREGYPVFAVADGYISRLRVQIGGFGNALYINHPNGITSVYGHLQKFNPRIALMIKGQQYKEKSYPQDFMLTPIEIPVKKGEIIAWSGNTGSSGGPHLHFELRNTQTEETINPLTLGIVIKDHIKPTINGFYVYQTNGQVFSENTPKQYYATAGTNGNYNLGSIETIAVNGEFGLGIMAYDQQDGSANKNGLFSTKIQLDGKTIYETVISKFSFDNTRAVNAYIDYYSKLSSGRVIQKGFTAANPKIKFYTQLANNGLIELKDNETHQVTYTLADISGNVSTLTLKVKNNPNLNIKAQVKPIGEFMSYKIENKFQNEDVKVTLAPEILYDDIYFKYSSSTKPSYGVSKIYQIHQKTTPVHSPYELAIKADSALEPYFDKIIVYNTESGSQGGNAKNGYIVCNPKIFGNFYLRIDTVAPKITPVNVREGVNLSQQKAMQFHISDSLSSIKSFNAYIDGNWVLAEFDIRNGSLWHTFDEQTGFGKHTFELIVTDQKDNQATYHINFYR